MTGQTTWRELISQPDRWERLLDRLDRGIAMPELDLAAIDEIVMVGSGTSYYLGLAAADWVRRRANVPARAVPSCEVILDRAETARRSDARRLVVAISRSGESTELVLAAKAFQAAGDQVLGISCVADSSLMQLADQRFLIEEGHEDGLVMLRSFTCMLIALHYLFGTAEDRAAMRALPGAAEAALGRTDAVRALVRSRAFDRYVFLASAASYPLALEASLKVQEMSISTAEAYHSLEYRHGPKATADENTFVTLFTLPNADHGTKLARDLKALGVTLLVVGCDAGAYAGIADLVIAPAGDVPPECAGPVDLLPLQVLAFETAMRRDKDPDAPVNLSKVVIL